jgi:hypothetical protein
MNRQKEVDSDAAPHDYPRNNADKNLSVNLILRNSIDQGVNQIALIGLTA